MINISWTPLARQRLNDIIDKIAQENKTAAQSISSNIIKKIRLLEQFPEMGRIVPELNHLFTRELIENNYRIIYRYNISQSEVIILTIRHVKELLTKKETK
ncbi:MAG: type II toxin-antitoxin system RelE/ParE family toxin [Acidobacteriota bacterium]